MEGVVLDCSMTMAWCFKEERNPRSEALRRKIEAGVKVAVPFIWTLEVINVLYLAEKRKRIVPEDTQRYVHWLYQGLPIEIDPLQNPILFQNLLLLMRGHELTAYDAAYAELALRRGWPLATLDTKLIHAARKMKILWDEP
ncbi:MAG: PIN domain-containing protein [Candidatus Omnitrophota bacterium]|jgi:predicted nucleic acid-binding protein|nr:MAG: PIN domain-containing protein [Candidatus Omnitrophota bacterium]